MKNIFCNFSLLIVLLFSGRSFACIDGVLKTASVIVSEGQTLVITLNEEQTRFDLPSGLTRLGSNLEVAAVSGSGNYVVITAGDSHNREILIADMNRKSFEFDDSIFIGEILKIGFDPSLEYPGLVDQLSVSYVDPKDRTRSDHIVVISLH